MNSASQTLLAARLDSLPITSFHRRMLWSLALIFFFELGNVNSFSFAAPAILKDWHLSISALSIIVSATFFGMFLGAVSGGRLADRVGRKRALVITVLWFSVFSLLNALAWEPVGLFMARLLTGMGCSAMTIVGTTYISEMFPAHQRGKYQGLIMAIGLLGIPATAYVARYSIPIAPWGWRLVFLWGALGMFFPLFMQKLEESPRWLERCSSSAEAEQAMARIVALAEKEKGWVAPLPVLAAPLPVVGVPFSELFKPSLIRRTCLFAIIWIFQTMGFYGFMSWAPTLLVQHGFSLVNSLAWSSAMQFGAAPGALLGALISDRWQRKWCIPVVAVAIAVFGLAYGLSGEMVPIIVFGFLVTMFIQTFAALCFSYTSESFPTASRSSGLGFTYGIGRVANIFGPLLIAFLFVHYGYRSVFEWIALCWLAVATVTAAAGPRTKGERL